MIVTAYFGLRLNQPVLFKDEECPWKVTLNDLLVGFLRGRFSDRFQKYNNPVHSKQTVVRYSGHTWRPTESPRDYHGLIRL